MKFEFALIFSVLSVTLASNTSSLRKEVDQKHATLSLTIAQKLDKVEMAIKMPPSDLHHSLTFDSFKREEFNKLNKELYLLTHYTGGVSADLVSKLESLDKDLDNWLHNESERLISLIKQRLKVSEEKSSIQVIKWNASLEQILKDLEAEKEEAKKGTTTQKELAPGEISKEKFIYLNQFIHLIDLCKEIWSQMHIEEHPKEHHEELKTKDVEKEQPVTKSEPSHESKKEEKGTTTKKKIFNLKQKLGSHLEGKAFLLGSGLVSFFLGALVWERFFSK